MSKTFGHLMILEVRWGGSSAAREAAGRAGEPFEIFLSLRGKLDRDAVQELEAMGVTALLLPAWALQRDGAASLAAKVCGTAAALPSPRGEV